jgi:hypothetical protein
MASTGALWLAVIASGVYHGLNPGMGWPLAVSAGLMDRRAGSLFAALIPLAFGHFLAITALLLPFAMLMTLATWQGSIQIAAGLGVVSFGFFKLFNRRHPRILSRIRPTQLAVWSFAVAIAHGAGLMLVPIYLGLCRTVDPDPGHVAIQTLVSISAAMAVAVVTTHAAAMIIAGGCAAWACYRYLGLTFIARSWLNLEAIWGSTLVLAGGIGMFAGLCQTLSAN